MNRASSLKPTNIFSIYSEKNIINIDTVVEKANTRFKTENIRSSALSFPSSSLFSLYKGINTEPNAPYPKSCVKKLDILNAPKYASVIPVAPKKLPISISLTRPRILLSIFIIITNKLDLNIIQPHNIKFIFFKLYINYSVFKEIQYT